MEKRPIIIIGSGPAGISTALSLKQIAPQLGSDLLVLEKDRHPRPKLCGGGITTYGHTLLRALGVCSKVRHFPIHTVRFHFDSHPIRFRAENLMSIVRRDEFDADLAEQARGNGITLRENQHVVDLRRVDGQIEVRTEHESYRAKVVVGADGANGIVRRKLVRDSVSRVSRLVETFVEVDPNQTEEYYDHLAVFDFRLIRDGVNGYAWTFPSYVGQRALLNVGVFDSGIRRGTQRNLRASVRALLKRRSLAVDNLKVKGHPERWFSPTGVYADSNVLLVGDAAGIEPWLGEGISMALAYGPIAASEIRTAFEKNHFEFRNYTQAILRDKLGRLLVRNRKIAKVFYTRPSQFLLTKVAKAWETYFNLRSERQSGTKPLA